MRHLPPSPPAGVTTRSTAATRGDTRALWPTRTRRIVAAVTLRRLVLPLLLVLPASSGLACRRPADPPTATPEPAKPSLLAGFTAQDADDPVAKEAQGLSDGPLAERAAVDAPGMQIEGDLIAGKLAPGEVVEQEFKLQPGRCYTLIAVGGDGVQELDAAFETIEPVRGKASALIADSASGNIAVIGGAGTCFPHPAEEAPRAVRWVLRVRSGTGVVVTQLYAR